MLGRFAGGFDRVRHFVLFFRGLRRAFHGLPENHAHKLRDAARHIRHKSQHRFQRGRYSFIYRLERRQKVPLDARKAVGELLVRLYHPAKIGGQRVEAFVGCGKEKRRHCNALDAFQNTRKPTLGLFRSFRHVLRGLCGRVCSFRDFGRFLGGAFDFDLCRLDFLVVKPDLLADVRPHLFQLGDFLFLPLYIGRKSALPLIRPHIFVVGIRERPLHFPRKHLGVLLLHIFQLGQLRFRLVQLRAVHLHLLGQRGTPALHILDAVLQLFDLLLQRVKMALRAFVVHLRADDDRSVCFFGHFFHLAYWHFDIFDL